MPAGTLDLNCCFVDRLKANSFLPGGIYMLGDLVELSWLCWVRVDGHMSGPLRTALE